MIHPVLSVPQQRGFRPRHPKLSPRPASRVLFGDKTPEPKLPNRWTSKFLSWLDQSFTPIKILLAPLGVIAYLRSIANNQQYFRLQHRKEVLDLDDAVHQVLLPSLPKHLRDLKAIGPEFTLEGVHQCYPELKPNKHYLVKKGYGFLLPSWELSAAINTFESQIYNKLGLVNNEKAPHQGQTSAEKPINVSPIMIKADGSVEVDGKPLISREDMVTQVSADEVAFSRETGHRFLQWLVKAAQVKPHLFRYYESSPSGGDSVVLTPVPYNPNPNAQRWR